MKNIYRAVFALIAIAVFSPVFALSTMQMESKTKNFAVNYKPSGEAVVVVEHEETVTDKNGKTTTTKWTTQETKKTSELEGKPTQEIFDNEGPLNAGFAVPSDPTEDQEGFDHHHFGRDRGNIAEESLGGFAAVFLIVVLISIGLTVFWFVMLIDCLCSEKISSNDKILWVLVMVFCSIIGSFIYYFMVKRKNKNAVVVNSEKVTEKEKSE